MKLGISGKTALITGGNRNIGHSISRALADEGVRLIIAARQASVCEEDFRDEKREHLFVDVDLMQEAGPQTLVTHIHESGFCPDIVVHNLGGSLDIRDTFAEVSEWEKVWRYNVGIGHEINRALLPAMIEKRWGRIIHLSTLATVTSEGNAAYMSAKCALEGYVRRVSKDFSRHNVIMNAVAPGLVQLPGRYFTEQAKKDPGFIEKYYDDHLAIRRMCQPDEVGKLVAFLCSEHSAYMPGAIVRMDGGGN